MVVKRKKTALAIGMAFSLSTLLSGISLASAAPGDPTSTDPQQSVKINLFHLTDIHGHIEMAKDKSGKATEAGLAAVKCYLDQATKDNPNSQFTLLGDNIGASPFTSGILYDNPTIEALNVMHPFASTIGNHELDLGQDVFKARIDGTSAKVNGKEVKFTKIGFDYMAANVSGLYGLKEGGYKIWESPSGVKVAYISAIAEDVPYKLDPGVADGITFSDPIKKVNDLAKELKESKKADIVVAMIDDDTKNNYPKMGKYVDVLMGGDTHTPYSFENVKGAEGNTLAATSSGSYTDNLSNVEVTFDKATGKVTAAKVQMIPAAEVVKCGEDPTVAEIVAKAKKESEKAAEETILDNHKYAYKRAVFTESDAKQPAPGSNRGHESTLGDLVGDSMKDVIVTQDGKPIDIGVIMAGGLRADLTPDAQGTIRYKDTYAVEPFSDQLGYSDLKGSAIKQILEEQWKTDLNSQNSRPMLKLGFSSNLQYTYDPTLPAGQRVTSVLVDGKPLDLEKTYRVGSLSFLLNGGDSFDGFKTAKPFITSRLDRDGFNEYLKKNPQIEPRKLKASIGINLPTEPLGEKSTAKIPARGLSFTEGPGITKNATLRIGGVEFKAPVDNTLVDPNNNKPTAIITTDGAGQATFEVKGSELVNLCQPGDKVRELPVEVDTDFGTVVKKEQGLTVKFTCPAGTVTPPNGDNGDNGNSSTAPNGGTYDQHYWASVHTYAGGGDSDGNESGGRLVTTGALASSLIPGVLCLIGVGAAMVVVSQRRHRCLQ